MTKAIAKTYNAVHEYRTKISITLIAVSVVMAVIYITNVYAVITRTVVIQNINAEIKTTESVVERLDAEYLGISSKINPDNLDVYGMSQGKVSEYISRGSSPALGRAQNLSRVAMSGYEF